MSRKCTFTIIRCSNMSDTCFFKSKLFQEIYKMVNLFHEILKVQYMQQNVGSIVSIIQVALSPQFGVEQIITKAYIIIFGEKYVKKYIKKYVISE